MAPRPARADQRCRVGLREARAAIVAGLAKPGAPPDREAGVPAGPPSGAAPCPAAQQSGSVRPQPRSIRVSSAAPAPADRYRQAETRPRGSGARSLASSRRARSRRFIGARRLLSTRSWTFRRPFAILKPVMHCTAALFSAADTEPQIAVRPSAAACGSTGELIGGLPNYRSRGLNPTGNHLKSNVSGSRR